jgi:hypothetical protein
MKRIIQGDVILKRIDAIPANAKLIEKKAKILQMSEITGHHHHFKTDANVDLFQLETDSNQKTITPNLGKYILVYEDSKLYHGKSFEEQPAKTRNGDHDAVTVPAGMYYIDIVREYDYDTNETVRVVD